MPSQPSNIERDIEALAMNIVHQIGDALYDALPKDVAHDHFVTARQATNDVAIDFATKLIKAREELLVREAHIDELEMAIKTRGLTMFHGTLVKAEQVGLDTDVIDPAILETRLKALIAQQGTQDSHE